MQPENKEQYYKAVKASEPPKEDGWYFTISPAGKPSIGLYEAPMWIGVMNPFYLEPIQLPDAAVLRDKMQEIAEATEGWKDGIGSVVNRIAREAISQTGDGWIRVDSGMLPERSSRMCWATYQEGEKIHVIEIRAEYIAINPKTYLHWQYQPPKPFPPKP